MVQGSCARLLGYGGWKVPLGVSCSNRSESLTSCLSDLPSPVLGAPVDFSASSLPVTDRILPLAVHLSAPGLLFPTFLALALLSSATEHSVQSWAHAAPQCSLYLCSLMPAGPCLTIQSGGMSLYTLGAKLSLHPVSETSISLPHVSFLSSKEHWKSDTPRGILSTQQFSMPASRAYPKGSHSASVSTHSPGLAVLGTERKPDFRLCIFFIGLLYYCLRFPQRRGLTSSPHCSEIGVS